jgi:hypothetical protein
LTKIYIRPGKDFNWHRWEKNEGSGKGNQYNRGEAATPN